MILNHWGPQRNVVLHLWSTRATGHHKLLIENTRDYCCHENQLAVSKIYGEVQVQPWLPEVWVCQRRKRGRPESPICGVWTNPIQQTTEAFEIKMASRNQTSHTRKKAGGIYCKCALKARLVAQIKKVFHYRSGFYMPVAVHMCREMIEEAAAKKLLTILCSNDTVSHRIMDIALHIQHASGKNKK